MHISLHFLDYTNSSKQYEKYYSNTNTYLYFFGLGLV